MDRVLLVLKFAGVLPMLFTEYMVFNLFYTYPM
jgi:hypothetical protein